MAQISITITEQDLKKLVVSDLENKLNCTINESDVIIEVKSKQNYRSEWETAAFRATINKESA